MITDDVAANLSALDILLEAERAMLLTGKLDELGDLVQSKEHLINAISGANDASPSALLSLEKKVKRNQLLLDGALDGIRAVARRLATLRRVRGSLDTYDAKGARKAIDMAIQSNVEKRA